MPWSKQYHSLIIVSFKKNNQTVYIFIIYLSIRDGEIVILGHFETFSLKFGQN